MIQFLCRRCRLVLPLTLFFFARATRASAQDPYISLQPQSLVFCTSPVGEVMFTTTYYNIDDVQWEYAPIGTNNWQPVPGNSAKWLTYDYADEGFLVAPVGDSLVGYQFMCVVWEDETGDSAISNIVTATYAPALPAPTILNHPAHSYICQGDSVTLSVADIVDTVHWYFNGALVSTGQQFTASDTGTYTAMLDNAYGCASAFSAPDSLSLYASPGLPVVSINQTNYGPCAPDTATLTIAGQAGAVYSWYFNDNAAPISGDNGDTIQTVTSGLYSAKVVNTGGCAARSGDVSVSIAPTAAPTTFISSSGTVCQGQTGVTYSIAPDSAGTVYAWSYSGKGATINGDSTTVTVNFGAGATSGVLQVQDSGYACAGSLALTLPITVDSLPGEPGGFINPDSVIDIGNPAPGSIYSYLIPGDSTVDFQWSYSGPVAVQTYGDTLAILQFYNQASSGTLSVSASNQCGTGPARTLNIQTLLPVTVSSFTAKGEVNKALLQWTTTEEFNAGTFILSKTTDHVTWTQLTTVPFSESLSGNTYSYVDVDPGEGMNYYALDAVPAAGGDSVSLDTSVNMDITNPYILLSPNPAPTTLTVTVNAGVFQKAEVFSQLGSVLVTEPINSKASQITIPVSNLPAGIYFLRLTGDLGVQKTKSFMKGE